MTETYGSMTTANTAVAKPLLAEGGFSKCHAQVWLQVSRIERREYADSPDGHRENAESYHRRGYADTVG